ncbi:bile acid:sodium symporter [Myxococcota bacterium]|nr:bile acid:sodium symporter [Myxococcota bacterium]
MTSSTDPRPARPLGLVATLVSRHAGFVFLAASLLGLVIPGLDRVPPQLVLALVGTVIFLACFKVDPVELRGLRPLALGTFWAWRFVAVPVLLYVAAARWFPEHALAILVLGLMPPAVATPGLVAILEGNVALALALLVGGTIVTPIVVPPIVAHFAGQGVVELDPMILARTLFFAVVLPILVHAPLRKFENFTAGVRRNLGTLSVSLISVSMALVVAQRRAVLLDDPSKIAGSLVLAFAVYFLFYGIGLAVPRVRRGDRIAFALCSGANNIVLGISLAVLHLSPADGAWAVTCLVPWSLGMVPLRRLAARR